MSWRDLELSRSDDGALCISERLPPGPGEWDEGYYAELSPAQCAELVEFLCGGTVKAAPVIVDGKFVRVELVAP